MWTIDRTISQSVSYDTYRTIKIKIFQSWISGRCHWALFSGLFAIVLCDDATFVPWARFCSLCNCIRYACRCLPSLYDAWMSVSLLYRFFVLIEFKVKRTATLKWKRREKSGKEERRKTASTLTLTMYDNSVHLRFFLFSYCSLHVCIHTHIILILQLAKHPFVCEIFFLFHLFVIQYNLNSCFFPILHLHCLFSNHSEKYTQFEKKMREKSDAHTHAHTERGKKRRDTCDEDKDER